MTRSLIILAAAISTLTGCAMTAAQLKSEVGALVVKPAMPAQKTAAMVGDGLAKCIEIEPSIRQAGDGTWIALADVGGPHSPGPIIVVEVSEDRAIVAPRWSSAGGSMAAMVAEWVERGEVTRCERTDADRTRWDAESKKL